MNMGKEIKDFIKIENDWFVTTENKGDTMMNKYGILGFLVYGLMRENITLRNVSIIQITDICDILQINKSKNTKLVNKIKEVILQMNDNIYKIYTDMQLSNELNEDDKLDNNKVYYCKFLKGNLENKFTIVYSQELFKIIDIEKQYRLEKGSLASQFTYICKNIGENKADDNYKVSFASIKNVSNNIGISENTIMGNNKLLTNNNLILCDNAGMTFKNDKVQNISNLYARPENKAEFNNYLELQKSKVVIVNKKKQDRLLTDKQRGLKQKIQLYIKNNHLDVNNLTVQQWIELNILEREYNDFVRNIRNKKVKSGSLVTIKLNSENREYISVKEWLIHMKYKIDDEGIKEITRLKNISESNKIIINNYKEQLEDLYKKDVNRMLYYFYNNVYEKLQK